jgi:hypothetical protein
VPCCSTCKEHNGASNVLWDSHSSVRDGLCNRISSSINLHESAGHLRGEKTWGNTVDKDVATAKLDRKVTGEMDDCGLGGGVSKSSVLAKGTDTETGDGGGNNDSGGIFNGGILL